MHGLLTDKTKINLIKKYGKDLVDEVMEVKQMATSIVSTQLLESGHELYTSTEASREGTPTTTAAAPQPLSTTLDTLSPLTIEISLECGASKTASEVQLLSPNEPEKPKKKKKKSKIKYKKDKGHEGDKKSTSS